MEFTVLGETVKVTKAVKNAYFCLAQKLQLQLQCPFRPFCTILVRRSEAYCHRPQPEAPLP